MSKPALLSIDRSEFPLVVARYRGASTTAEFESYLDSLLDVYRGGKPFALIFDSRGGEAVPATHRKLQADWIRTHEHLIRQLNVGTAFVLDSVMLRGVLTAILWLQPLPCPHVVCSDPAEAKRWARARLDALGRRKSA